jgi:hypothetical protein
MINLQSRFSDGQPLQPIEVAGCFAPAFAEAPAWQAVQHDNYLNPIHGGTASNLQNQS